MVQRFWLNFQSQGILLIWIRVRQGSTALAVRTDGRCLDISVSVVYPFSFPSSSLGDSQIQTEILSQRAIKAKTTNHLSLKNGDR